MSQGDIINDTRVIVAFPDKEERKKITGMLENRGISEILEVDSGLEMVLAASAGGTDALIADAEIGVIGLPDALRYITDICRYITVCVVSGSWTEELREEYLGLVDVFASRPVSGKNILPGLTLSIARKRHMLELEKEYIESEQSFAAEKNIGFAKHLVMDKLGLSEESAGKYLLSVGEKYGYDDGGVARIVYDVLLSGDKKK